MMMDHTNMPVSSAGAALFIFSGCSSAMAA